MARRVSFALQTGAERMSPASNYTLAILCALSIGTVLLFLGGPDSESPRWFAELWNYGHIIYFALLAGLLLKLPPIKRQTPVRQWLIVLGFTLLSGSLIEVLQQYTQRDAQLGDVARDLAGGFLLLAFAPASGARSGREWQLGIRLAASTLLILLLLPLCRILIDEASARWQFPVLANFETPFEMDRWSIRPDLAARITASPRTGHMLEIPLSSTRYSGIGLRYFPGDWHEYRFLQVELYNPDRAPLRITCRIHDLAHTRGTQHIEDRYNQRFVLESGWNTLRIDLRSVTAAPLHRSMDMRQIRGIGFFASSLPAPRRLYLDNLRLSDEP